MGEWGSLKHPTIYSLVENNREHLSVIFIISLFVSAVIYFGLIRFNLNHSKPITRGIVINLALYVLTILALFGFGFILSGLASQGAGH